MPNFDDPIDVHLDALTKEAGPFSLASDGKGGWTATGVRKGGRKEFITSSSTPIDALAGLLTALREESAEAE